jgi:hypothetical protein
MCARTRLCVIRVAVCTIGLGRSEAIAQSYVLITHCTYAYARACVLGYARPACLQFVRPASGATKPWVNLALAFNEEGWRSMCTDTQEAHDGDAAGTSNSGQSHAAAGRSTDARETSDRASGTCVSPSS